MTSRISEIILLLVLVVITGFTRIYYGGVAGPMVVWKTEFGYKDTLVNLADLSKLSTTEMERDHAQALAQLEDMGIVEDPVRLRRPAAKNRKVTTPTVQAKDVEAREATGPNNLNNAEKSENSTLKTAH